MLCVAAGTEINSCLVWAGSLQKEGEICSLVSRDTVSIGDISFVNFVTVGVVDQPQPQSWVLSIPVHIVIILILRTFQNNAVSFLCNLIPWGLENTSIYVPCEKTKQKLESEPQKCPLATVSREKPQPESGNLRQRLPTCFPSPPVPRRQEATQQKSMEPMARRGRVEAFPALGIGGNRAWK